MHCGDEWRWTVQSHGTALSSILFREDSPKTDLSYPLLQNPCRGQANCGNNSRITLFLPSLCLYNLTGLRRLHDIGIPSGTERTDNVVCDQKCHQNQ